MIKLIASDLDGTLLLNGAQSLPEEIFPIIRRLKEMGILFVAASGRQYGNMKRLFAPVADHMGFVCENGALAIENDEVFYQDAFDQELAMEITRSIQEREGSEFSYSTKDYYYLIPKTKHYEDLMVNIVKNNCRMIKSFDEIQLPCIKLAVYERGGASDESIRYWRERFGDRCTVVTSGNDWVDFIPFGTNKAKGVEVFRKRLGITADECMAFGDEFNDLEMLKSVTYGYAMAHGRPAVREAARCITERVEPVLEQLIRAGGNITE